MVARDSKVNVGEINGWLTIGVQLIGRAAFEYLYRENKVISKEIKHIITSSKSLQNLRKAHVQSTLTTRFQLEQNLLVMDILKMFANISSVYLFLHAFTFMGVLKLKDFVSMPVYFALVESESASPGFINPYHFPVNSSYPIYGIISILLMIHLLRKNRRKVHDNLTIHVKSKWEGDDKNFGAKHFVS